MSVVLPGILTEAIREHGRKAYPHECCGLIVGYAVDGMKRAEKLKAMENAREDSPHNRYLISPEEFLKADLEAHQSGMDIIGVYHSHPDHPARPSEFDRAHAFPWYSYVIVSVKMGEPVEMASWTLLEDRSAFENESLEII